MEDVVIVGAGPVGLSLGIDLTLRGCKVVIFEKHATLHHIPRGQNLTARSMEILRGLGVAEHIRRERPIKVGKSGISGGLELYGGLDSPYTTELQERGRVARFYSEKPCRIPQYLTEKVLRARSAELGIDVRYGEEVERVELGPDSCTVHSRNRKSGAQTRCVGQYVAGCDGAHSMVREAAGIGQTVSDHGLKMALFVFKSAALTAYLEEHYPGRTFFNIMLDGPKRSGYWFFLGMVEKDVFFFHAPVEENTNKDNLKYQEILDDALGRAFPIEVTGIYFWRMAFAISNTYVKDRVCLAGDSAHSHPPYGGYGINNGLEDVANLGWKLASLVHGQAKPVILDSYSVERHAAFRSLVDDYIEGRIYRDQAFQTTFARQVGTPAFEQAWAKRRAKAIDRVFRFAAHYDGSSIVPGGPGAAPSSIGYHGWALRVGHRAPEMPLTDGRTLSAALGQGFSLLTIGLSEREIEKYTAAFARHGIEPTLIAEKLDSYYNHDGVACAWVIRPDRHVSARLLKEHDEGHIANCVATITGNGAI